MLKLQYFGHLMWRANSLARILMLGKTEGKRRSGGQEAMAGWHHWLNGHEFEQTQGESEGQGSLACCSPWGHKESDTSEHLSKNNQWSFHKTQKEGVQKPRLVNENTSRCHHTRHQTSQGRKLFFLGLSLCIPSTGYWPIFFIILSNESVL